ncbi:MAG: hypothetical protein AAFP92_23640 [Bacteroidota bacterium]
MTHSGRSINLGVASLNGKSLLIAGSLLLICVAAYRVFFLDAVSERQLIGKVIDGQSSEPVAGVEVRFINHGELISQKTDNEGNFVLRFQPDPKLAEEEVLSFFHEEYEPVHQKIRWKQVVAPGKLPDISLQVNQLGQKAPQKEVLENIASVGIEVRDSREKIMQDYALLKQKDSISLDEKLKINQLEGLIKQYDYRLKYLIEDSLLYSLRQINEDAVNQTIQQSREADQDLKRQYLSLVQPQ